MSSIRRSLLQLWRNRFGIAAVASTYVFFLIFAQYGFLRLLEEHLSGEVVHGAQADELRAIMAIMGVTGLLSSLSTPLLSRALVDGGRGRTGSTRSSEAMLATSAGSRDRMGHKMIMFGFLACTFTAAIAMLADRAGEFYAVAASIGLSLGCLTVSLATHARSLLPAPGYGLAIGAGTGLAYWICNLPPIFEGDPELQTLVAGTASLIGFVMVSVAPPLCARSRALTLESPVEARAVLPADCRGLGLVTVVLVFLALVWVDSAAFSIIQETLGLKSETWGSPTQKLVMGSSHLLAALFAGWLIDRGFFRSLPVAALSLFVVSFALLTQHDSSMLLTGPLYAIGISLYSVALVAYPAFVPDRPGLAPRRWRAALVYAVGGWLGSALGIGMAQDLHRIPAWFLTVAGLLVVTSWLLPKAARMDWTSQRFRTLRELARSFGGALLVAGLAGLAVLSTGWLSRGWLSTGLAGVESRPETPKARGDHERIAFGRSIYIAEGCINCHSQYVRPQGHDRSWWGPESKLEQTIAARPPLLGNRRQGPDLSNVGNRRSPLWQELHLREPRSVSPGSRMPSYEHLFEDDRGSALLAYLNSLGEGTEQERRVDIDAWRPDSMAVAQASADRGQELFASFCARCHGQDATGSGTVLETLRAIDSQRIETARYQLERPSMNLRKESFVLVDWGPARPVEDSAPLESEIARLIRFGMPGTSMPGHESLPEQAIADLAAFVLTLPRGPSHLARAVDDSVAEDHP